MFNYQQNRQVVTQHYQPAQGQVIVRQAQNQHIQGNSQLIYLPQQYPIHPQPQFIP
jgi:hypothetical protein